ncbi:MAG: PilN domain-containing protein [Syntrophomonas sp.]|nr:PilN domain-containing protein [Syntrophomonas sp.]
MQNLVQININLLEQAAVNKLRLLYWGFGFMIMAIIVSVAGYSYMSLNEELNNQKIVNADFKLEVKKYNAEILGLKPIQELEKEMARKSQEVDEIEKEQVSFSNLITEIDKVIPPKVVIVGVEIKAQKVVVTGFSPDHSQVARLLEGLKGSSRFKNMTVLSSKMDEKIDEAKFTMELDLEAEKK